MTNEEARARVAVGAALLDEHRPGWAEAIDTRELDLRFDCNCILGQLEGSYNKAIRRWFSKYRNNAIARAWHRKADKNHCEVVAIKHGFDVEDRKTPFGEFNAKRLQAAWIEAIADRVVTAKLSDAVRDIVHDKKIPARTT